MSMTQFQNLLLFFESGQFFVYFLIDNVIVLGIEKHTSMFCLWGVHLISKGVTKNIHKKNHKNPRMTRHHMHGEANLFKNPKTTKNRSPILRCLCKYCTFVCTTTHGWMWYSWVPLPRCHLHWQLGMWT